MGNECTCGGLHQVTIDCRLAAVLADVLPRLADALERFEHPRPVTAALTRQEAADELRVSVRTLAALIDGGKLQAVRVGSRVLVPRTEVERLLAARRRRDVRAA